MFLWWLLLWERVAPGVETVQPISAALGMQSLSGRAPEWCFATGQSPVLLSKAIS
jgi:hypothetical protein